MKKYVYTPKLKWCFCEVITHTSKSIFITLDSEIENRKETSEIK